MKKITYEFELPNGKKMLIPHQNFQAALAIAASESGVKFLGTSEHRPAPINEAHTGNTKQRD